MSRFSLAEELIVEPRMIVTATPVKPPPSTPGRDWGRPADAGEAQDAWVADEDKEPFLCFPKQETSTEAQMAGRTTGRESFRLWAEMKKSPTAQLPATSEDYLLVEGLGILNVVAVLRRHTDGLVRVDTEKVG